MLRHLLRWWGSQLAQLWPWHGRAEAVSQRALLLDPVDSPELAVTLTWQHRGTDRLLGQFLPNAAGRQALQQAVHAAGHAPIVLRLPPGTLLEREAVLPLAAEQDAEAALRHDLDRLTPFRAADLIWSSEAIDRDHQRGLLHLRLLLVPRATVEDILAVMAASGIAVSALQGRGADGTVRRIVLESCTCPPWHRVLLRGAALTCMCLALASAAAPFLRQAALLAALDAKIATFQPLAREASEIRRQLMEETASGDIITSAQLEFGTALSVLAAVTDALPDDTFLLGLTLKQRQLVLRGQSGNAARLIALLTASEAIHSPSFAAPVTRVAGDGQDQFTIAATLGR
jgi:general secretion pathway protein L